MSDQMRWRYGDTNPVIAAVDPATAIEQGDLVYQDVDDAKPARMVDRVYALSAAGAWNPRDMAGSLQQPFAKNFLGVAMQRSRSGDTDPIRVATTGVFEFDCPASKFELGDLMGVGCGYAEVGKLDNQRVDEVSKKTPGLAIARVAKRIGTAAASVLVDIRSTVMGGIDNQ